MVSSNVPASSDVSDNESDNGAHIEPDQLSMRVEKKKVIAETCESVVVDPEG